MAWTPGSWTLRPQLDMSHGSGWPQPHLTKPGKESANATFAFKWMPHPAYFVKAFHHVHEMRMIDPPTRPPRG